MAIKTLLVLVASLTLSGHVLAQSGPRGASGGQGSQVTHSYESSRASQRNRPAQSARPVQSVPELDGGKAFLALGLIFAVGCLIREKRRAS